MNTDKEKNFIAVRRSPSPENSKGISIAAAKYSSEDCATLVQYTIAIVEYTRLCGPLKASLERLHELEREIEENERMQREKEERVGCLLDKVTVVVKLIDCYCCHSFCCYMYMLGELCQTFVDKLIFAHPMGANPGVLTDKTLCQNPNHGSWLDVRILCSPRHIHTFVTIFNVRIPRIPQGLTLVTLIWSIFQSSFYMKQK